MYSLVLVAKMVASWEWIVGQSAADKVLLVSRYEDVTEEERKEDYVWWPRRASRGVAVDGCWRRGRVLMTLLAARTGVNKGRNQSGRSECARECVGQTFLPARQPGSFGPTQQKLDESHSSSRVLAGDCGISGCLLEELRVLGPSWISRLVAYFV